MASHLKLVASESNSDRDYRLANFGPHPAYATAVLKSNLWMTAALFGVNLVMIGLVLAIGNVALVAALAIVAIGGALIPIGWRFAYQTLEPSKAGSGRRATSH